GGFGSRTVIHLLPLSHLWERGSGGEGRPLPLQRGGNRHLLDTLQPEGAAVFDERAKQALLDWYRAGHRDLPWRHTRDPYRILVSEVMLQQTQAERVIPKYHEFLARFPTLQTLADAPASEV